MEQFCFYLLETQDPLNPPPSLHQKTPNVHDSSSHRTGYCAVDKLLLFHGSLSSDSGLKCPINETRALN